PRRDGDVVDELHVLERIDAVLPKRSLEEEIRRAAGPQRQDLLALKLLPVELVGLLAPDQHETVGHGEPAEDRYFGRRVAVLHVDRRLRSDQGDVRAVGEQRRHRFVAALRGRHRHVEARVFEVTAGEGHVGGRIENRAHDLAVANLHRRLCLRECVERRGDEQQAESGETNLKSAAAVEHGDSRVLALTGTNCTTPRQRRTQVLDPHLCRCTGYVRYYEAVREVILATPGLVRG